MTECLLPLSAGRGISERRAGASTGLVGTGIEELQARRLKLGKPGTGLSHEDETEEVDGGVGQGWTVFCSSLEPPIEPKSGFND